MRKLIVLGTILAFSAFAVVSAQTTKVQAKPGDAQKVTQTAPEKKDTPQTLMAVPGDASVNKEAASEKPEVKPNQLSAVTNVPAVSNKPVRMGEHAPDINDPEYHAKLEIWAKRYPEELKTYLNSKANSNK